MQCRLGIGEVGIRRVDGAGIRQQAGCDAQVSGVDFRARLQYQFARDDIQPLAGGRIGRIIGKNELVVITGVVVGGLEQSTFVEASRRECQHIVGPLRTSRGTEFLGEGIDFGGIRYTERPRCRDGIGGVFETSLANRGTRIDKVAAQLNL